MRAAWPKEKPVGVRISAIDWVERLSLDTIQAHECALVAETRSALSGMAGVTLFFVLSGFVMCHVYKAQFDALGWRAYPHFLLIRLGRYATRLLRPVAKD